MSRGWLPVEEHPVIVDIQDVGEIETYDIEMPGPHHNYVLANGIVTHNSHTVSYSIISYWCAYLKTYHPLEYAAACLRHAKDDEQTIEILRELGAEGVPYTPFDPQKSAQQWKAVDGALVGGYQNLIGIGPIKASYWVQRRDKDGLSEADLEKIGKHKVKFGDLRPTHTLYGDIYDYPEQHNIRGRVKEFGELADKETAVVICRLLRLERRDEDETVRVARRGGKKWRGPTLFLDTFMVDDSVSSPIRVRINIRLWDIFGEVMADRAVPGDYFLIRGRYLSQFAMMNVYKIRCLSNPEVFE